jgi:hypothetical protein
VEGKGGVIIRVTITRGATIKVSILGTDRCTKGINKIGEKSYSEDLKSKPSPRVTSVVIHIYFFALHEFFSL